MSPPASRSQPRLTGPRARRSPRLPARRPAGQGRRDRRRPAGDALRRHRRRQGRRRGRHHPGRRPHRRRRPRRLRRGGRRGDQGPGARPPGGRRAAAGRRRPPRPASPRPRPQIGLTDRCSCAAAQREVARLRAAGGRAVRLQPVGRPGRRRRRATPTPPWTPSTPPSRVAQTQLAQARYRARTDHHPRADRRPDRAPLRQSRRRRLDPERHRRCSTSSRPASASSAPRCRRPRSRSSASARRCSWCAEADQSQELSRPGAAHRPGVRRSASCSRTIPPQRTDDRVVEVVVSADGAPFLIGQRVLVKFEKPGA